MTKHSPAALAAARRIGAALNEPLLEGEDDAQLAEIASIIDSGDAARDALLKRVADDAFSLACSSPDADSYHAIRARLDETLRLVPGCTFKDSPSDMQLRAEAAERELGKMTELLNQALRATGLLEDRK